MNAFVLKLPAVFKRHGILPFFALLAGVAGFLGGCATDRVATDLVNYVNRDILGIAELEKRALESYAGVTGENFTTPQRVYSALKDEVIPEYEQFYKLLRNLRPETAEVSRLHQIYVKGAGYLLEGFKMKMSGLERRDEQLVVAANRQIEKGRKENERWRAVLVELCKKHGVAEKGRKGR